MAKERLRSIKRVRATQYASPKEKGMSFKKAHKHCMREINKPSVKQVFLRLKDR